MERILLTKSNMQAILMTNDGFIKLYNRGESFAVRFIKNRKLYDIFPDKDSRSGNKIEARVHEISWNPYSYENDEIQQFIVDYYDELNIPIFEPHETIRYRYDLRGSDSYGHVIIIPGGESKEDAIYRKIQYLQEDVWPYNVETDANGRGCMVVEFQIIDRDTGAIVASSGQEETNRAILEKNNGFKCEGRDIKNGKLIKQHFCVDYGTLFVTEETDGMSNGCRPCEEKEIEMFISNHMRELIER